MNKFLLLAAGLSVSVAAVGQNIAGATDIVKSRVSQGHATEAKVAKVAGSPLMILSAENGKALKKVNRPVINTKVNPTLNRKAPAAREEGLASSDILFESFEGWDGITETWVPDGWTVESFGSPENIEYYQKWFPSAQGLYAPAPTDGNYYYGVIFASADQDEWLISPAVTVGEGMNLYFDMNIDPIFFYNLDKDHVDWDNMTFIGEREIVCDVKVNIREEGGEWATLIDFAEQFKSMSILEMYDYNPYQALLPQSALLSAYAGKKVQIAFQYVGKDGQSTYMDNIRIGLPKLKDPVYQMPLSTQYWGFTRDLNATNMGVAMLPVFTDNTWMSYDYVDGGVYTWEYNDPAEADNWLTANGDMLTVAYGTDYTSAFTTRNNLYYLPKLTVSAEGAAPATYQNPANYMQMGGKPDFIAKNSAGEDVELNMGLVPFMRTTEGLGTYTYRSDFGEPSIPLFGYNSEVDKYWTDYTYKGDAGEGDGVKLTSILNFIYSSEAPMVVTGVTLPAMTEGIGENVEFKVGIYTVNDDFTPNEESPLATATLLGKDVKVLNVGDQEPDLSMLVFEFEQPVVLDNSSIAYVVMLSGFNNPDITYFCPMQSLYPADVPMAYGWICKDITYQGETRKSYSYPIDPETDEPMYTSFALNLEAYLPWLHCEAESIEISDNGSILGFDSYYAAEDLKVTAPYWAEATLSGRYGSTELTVKAEFSETAREGDIVIEAPGVSKTLKVIQKAGTGSGIADIIVDGDDTVTAVYNLAGQQVAADNLPAGVYLVKYASGKVAKVAVK